ncbi:MAG: ASKHA domain-containing protein [Acidimicrobiaceae bacterium]|nr:ASKHA domain-containing protein [Acidimicrobiaceae bacterium]
MVFNPSSLRASVTAGATVLDAARAAGVDLDSVCGGRGLCGRCQISTISDDSLSAVGESEQQYRGRRRLAEGHRLGCQAVVLADAGIDVPAASQVHRPVVRKSIDLGEVVVDPLVTLHYVELPDAASSRNEAAGERLAEALADDWGIKDTEFSLAALASLSRAVASDACAELTAVVHGRRRVVDVRSGYSDGAWGMAVDVGSTTIAGYLVELGGGEVVATSGRMNPQIRFGEDLMSRVSYVMMNPHGRAELTAAARSAVDDLAGDLCRQAGVDRSEVHDLVVVGNPVMHHLLLGLDPTALGTAPFTLTVSDAVNGRAADIGVSLENAALYAGPCIAGHVGADAAAAALAEEPHHSEAPMLVVDVGTNAEIMLGDRNRLLAASSPTGPAFEGGEISCGQRAAAGAVERIRIDPDTWEPRFKVIGCELWSDDPGFAGALEAAGLQVTGLCGSGIIEVIAEMFLAGIIDRDGVVTADQSRSPRIVGEGRTFSYVLQTEPVVLSVTQNDVRAVQLAKAALRAGIDLLRDHAGVTEAVQVRLAGAFGAHIDPLRAMVLGLVPDTPVAGVRAAGNASGVGAVRMLLSSQQRREVEQLVRSVTKIETATEPRFQELFVAAMAFPHATEPTPHLAAMVKLPTAGAEQTNQKERLPQRRNRARRQQAQQQQRAQQQRKRRQQ